MANDHGCGARFYVLARFWVLYQVPALLGHSRYLFWHGNCVAVSVCPFVCLTPCEPAQKPVANSKCCMDRYYPATGAITEWFNEKRPLALGLAASGSAVGGALWSTYIPKLNNKLPHGAIFLVIGGLAAPLLFLGCLLIRERKGAAGHDVSGDEVRPSQRSIRAAVLEWRFLALTWSLVILNTGILIPSNFLVVYAREKEVSEDVAYNLVAYTYLGSIIGRIGSGLLADFFGW